MVVESNIVGKKINGKPPETPITSARVRAVAYAGCFMLLVEVITAKSQYSPGDLVTINADAFLVNRGED